MTDDRDDDPPGWYEDLVEAGEEVGQTLRSTPEAGRRAFIGGLVGAAGVGVLGDVVAAQQYDDAACEWLGDQDANGNVLMNLGAMEFIDGSVLESADGGGGGEWTEDGSGNIVPIDGETVGDGTTTANHDAVTANTSITDAAGVSHSGELSDNPHDNADHSTDMVEDATTTGNAPYEIQKNGTDGTGVINFKT